MELEHLVHPLVSSQGPCGEDMIFSAEFDQIQEARRFEDPSLAQGEWVTEVKEADWEIVVRICEKILGKQSKDLRIAAWLTEAKGKIGGLAGLADGYALLDLLCNTFWEEIHPQEEDGEYEQRIGLLDWLVNQTSRLIREIPLTNSPKGHFSLIDQESARTTAKNIERNPGQAEELGRNAHVTLESFEAALKDTPRKHFVDGIQDAEALKDSMGSLQAVLDVKLGEQAPAFSSTFDALDDISRFYRRQVGDVASKAPELPNISITGDTQENEPVSSSPSQATVTGPIRSRDQAIRQLQEIAEFFRRTEPHSPVAYLADKAAKWGSMSLHEWLRTVVKDGGALSHMEELLGVDARLPGEG